MANEDNIKKHEFKKGQSGNPKGRPKGSLNRSTIARRWLEATRKGKNPLTGEDEVLSQEDIITLALIRKGMDGDVPAYRALMDSGYGTAKDTIDINTNEVGIDFDELLAAMKKNGKQ
mgnify:CR=1 FL=1|tara:strand:+ start:1423 stop:1773 length:351 start_codon:yes stop_codon:yes gene_type:complete